MLAVLWLLQLPLWDFAGAVVTGTPPSLPVSHRPGATFIKGPKVSSARGNYRLILDLSTYDYDPEFSAMKAFQISSNKSQTVLLNLHQDLRNQTSSSESLLKKRLVLLFQDLAVHLSTALSEFKNKQTLLKSLQGNLSQHEKLSTPASSRGDRDVADYVGLASTGELAELNHWVTQLQNSETKLAHSAEQQLSYLNRTIQRVNYQENRLNQLALIDIKWDRTIHSLQQSTAEIPEYFELVLTLIQGLSVVSSYENKVRPMLDKDIQHLRELAAHHLPHDLLTPQEFQKVLTNAHAHMLPGFTFSDGIETLTAKLSDLPVQLLRDHDNHRLCAKITIPVYSSSDAFQLVKIVPASLQNPQLPGIHEVFDLPGDLIAVSDTQFFELDPHDLYDCNDPKSSVRDYLARSHLCVTPRAIITYHSKGPITSCAASLYFEPTVPVPAPCKTHVQLVANHVFTRLIRNIWMYAPAQDGLLRFLCPQAAPAPIDLHPDGGQIIMPPACSGVTGQVQIPAYILSDFHVTVPNQTHFHFHTSNSSFWIHQVALPPSTDSHQLMDKVRSALSTSTSLEMPLDHFKHTLDQISTELNQNSVTHFMQHNSAAPHAGTIVTVIILAALAMACCCLGKCCWRRYRRTQNRSVPQAIPMVAFAPPIRAPVAAPPAIELPPDSPRSPRNVSDRGPSRRTRSRTRRPRTQD